MGILNLTPDSFSDGGRFFNLKQALQQAKRIEQEGAHILDIGAESTRPGAPQISIDEEANRLFPILHEIIKQVQIPISIDTTKSKIAEESLRMGVQIINDVSGLRHDPKLADSVHKYGAGLVLMHRRGTSETMQSLTSYDSLIPEILNELSQSIRIALSAGISDDQIVVDPGLGFSKTAEQNFEIIRELYQFKHFSRPILVGASRKSFLGKLTGRNPEERDISSSAIAALLVERGANILRVHDVASTKDAILVATEVGQL